MTIIIDATSTLVRSAGVKNYIWHWILHLRKLGADVRAFPFLKDFGKLDHEASVLSRPATMARFALIKAMNEAGFPPLDWLIRGADVFHATNLLRRAPRRAKLTATIHDLTCWLMPELHTPGNVKADYQFAERVLWRADGLIAVNGISIHEDRIFADEFRPGGRMWELYPDGRSPLIVTSIR